MFLSPPLSCSLFGHFVSSANASCPCCRKQICKGFWPVVDLIGWSTATHENVAIAALRVHNRSTVYPDPRSISEAYVQSVEAGEKRSIKFPIRQDPIDGEKDRVAAMFEKDFHEEITKQETPAQEEETDAYPIEEERISIPELPSNILAYVIAPFLSDRRTFNNFSMISKEVHEMCKEIVDIPWPETMFRGRRTLWSLAYSPDGRILAAGCGDGRILLWDRRRGSLPTLTGHLGRVYSIVFAPDGRTMVSGSGDGDVRAWDIEAVLLMDEEKQCRQLDINTPHIHSLAFSHDGSIFASSGDGTIRLYDSCSRQCMSILQDESRIVESISFSPDGTMLASGTWRAVINFWDIGSRQCIFSLQDKASVHSIAFSPDGKYVACGSDKPIVRLWNISTRDYVTLEGHTDSVWSVDYAPDGQHIASASDDGTVRIWSTASGKCTAISNGKADVSVYSVKFSPDSRMVASASGDGTVAIRKYY